MDLYRFLSDVDIVEIIVAEAALGGDVEGSGVAGDDLILNLFLYLD